MGGEARSDAHTSLQESLLAALFECDVMELLSVISQHASVSWLRGATARSRDSRQQRWQH
jgi:hypothetical protein